MVAVFWPISSGWRILCCCSLVFTILWFTCRARSAVFWKRTDYFYFLLTILGGAAAAADIAMSNWTKELEQTQFGTPLPLSSCAGTFRPAISYVRGKRKKEIEQHKLVLMSSTPTAILCWLLLRALSRLLRALSRCSSPYSVFVFPTTIVGRLTRSRAIWITTLRFAPCPHTALQRQCPDDKGRRRGL